ncbi:hypothetical protein ASPZODRAFT_73914 [Penicilliopsis zonata CBS 506.65]|uniref:Ketoreductase domain-containing protein n=1 Tax=Penicilliopsis zonata CBS 506.65 TaxID=1073090 RepID=A0A1L9S8S4_9EURO|nr:hypothetical protein ASPZODRAFT_73914 [Penicilliopsis zonata CBS 506.65]OJJ43560.1 hypothetical protein ASPZODRAFT_73914 [Penicilliopsis zonata CBS 506.65]
MSAIFSLQGKVAIVTGSGRSKGIGAAIAALLALHGAAVVVNFLSPATASQAEGVVRGIAQQGGQAVAVQADISTEAGVQALVDAAVELGGKIDIIVNNAVAGSSGPALQASLETIQYTFAVNVAGPVLLIKAAVAHMPPRSRIINIGSIASRIGGPGSALYGASKAAMDALTYSMAWELGRDHGGITINTVAPGPVDTESLPAPVAAKIHGALIPMTRVEERVGTVQEIADAVLLLCSEKSRWISGQCISVSGGITGGV